MLAWQAFQYLSYLPIWPSLICVAVIEYPVKQNKANKQINKELWEEGVYLSLQFQVTVHASGEVAAAGE